MLKRKVDFDSMFYAGVKNNMDNQAQSNPSFSHPHKASSASFHSQMESASHSSGYFNQINPSPPRPSHLCNVAFKYESTFKNFKDICVQRNNFFNLSWPLPEYSSEEVASLIAATMKRLRYSAKMARECQFDRRFTFNDWYSHILLNPSSPLLPHLILNLPLIWSGKYQRPPLNQFSHDSWLLSFLLTQMVKKFRHRALSKQQKRWKWW